ncbi:acyl CoA:acetate/3-ketoacid CoA transferase [bacterium]|nr:MAG: acyl CoA:acetate/3-ketoacid CoA transferase [bacterium]
MKSTLSKGKVVSAEEAVRLIHDGDVVATDGFVGNGFAEEVAIELEKYFLETGHPRGLTLIYAAGQGDGKERGLNHFAREGMVKRVIGGHWGLAPKLQKLAINNQIEAYNLPQGVVAHMFRDIAAHKPRTITRVGLGTFVDPRLDGGKVNACTTEEIVEVVQFDGKDYLAYKLPPINVAIIRGTTADINGNITMEKEALTLEVLSVAMAARNSGGYIIVQVERIADACTLNPRNVKIPAMLVDCVVVAKPENHMQTFGTQYNPAYSSEIRVPATSVAPMVLDERKIIARRAAFELCPNSIVNLGIGMPEGVSSVANEEGVLSFMTLTTEPGTIGGIPAGGLDFGASTNMECLLDQPYQFDFYDGGGLDLTVLGLAQADQYGNLNVSKFGPRLAGAGGFINISQNAKKVVFVGTFTAGASKLVIEDGTLKIEQDGNIIKFVEKVEHVTYSGKTAVMLSQPVLYVTERCVFVLTPDGMELTEVAPGVDIEKDILAKMAFKPIIKGKPALMDPRIFQADPMGLKDDLGKVPMGSRFRYDAARNLFFVNFEGLSIRTEKDIMDIHRYVDLLLNPLGKKVRTIVNYEHFSILPELEDEYFSMVKDVMKYYERTSRYATNAFLRSQVGEGLTKKEVTPQIFENKEEAELALSN